MVAIACKGKKDTNYIVYSYYELKIKNNLIVDHIMMVSSKNGYNSFRFDFRPHGESEGIDYNVSIKKEIEDLEATIKMLKEKGYKEFILLGASFGAGIISLLDYNKHQEIKSLILWYGATNFDYVKYGRYFSDENKKMAEQDGFYISVSPSTGKAFRFGKEIFNDVNTYKPYENLAKNTLPKLFVHGKIDTILPYTLSEETYKKCENANIVLIENGNHTFDNSEKALNEAIQVTIKFMNDME